jgi:tRNA threonylcarbamoyladenosine biosynthesis protein TsaB
MSTNSVTNSYSIALETSGRIGGVAIGRGADIHDVASFRTTLNHGVELLPTIDRLCRRHGIPPSGIGQVYFSGGPGSFTGLRIGVTVARTLAWAGGIGVVRVPTLDVIAQNALSVEDPPANLGVVLDAKRGHVYAAAFVRRRDRYERIGDPDEWDPERFFQTLPDGAAVIGEGIERIVGRAWPAVLAPGETAGKARPTVLPQETWRPQAEVVYRLGFERAFAGDFDDPANLIPIYIRRPEAEEVWERKHGHRDD